jgi:predicted ATPase
VLRTLRIENYKSLRDVTVELGRFNVVIGGNGAGKTNFLEALGLLGCAASGRVDDDSLMKRGIRPGLPSLYKTAFAPLPDFIEVTASADTASYRVALENPLNRPESAWRFAHEALREGEQCIAERTHGSGIVNLGLDKDRLSLTLGPHEAIATLAGITSTRPAISALLEALRGYAIYTPFTPMLRGTTPDPGQRDPVGLAGGRLAEAVLGADAEQLQAIVHDLIDWAAEFDVGTAASAQLSPAVAATRDVLRFRDRYMVEGRNWLSAFDASEGALYVLFLAVLAVHPHAPRLLAVDNVDQALNPRLARALIERVQDLVLADPTRPQMLLTTHNPLVLDALRLEHPDVRLLIVERQRDGSTGVRPLVHSDALTAARANDMPLSRLWLGGLLGGMPDL